MLFGKRIKVYNAIKSTMTGKCGEVLVSDSKLVIATNDSSVELTDVQPEGGKRMRVADMLRGRNIEKGTIIEVIK